MKSSTLKILGYVFLFISILSGCIFFFTSVILEQTAVGVIALLAIVFTGFVSYSIFAAFAEIIEQNNEMNNKLIKLIKQIETPTTKKESLHSKKEAAEKVMQAAANADEVAQSMWDKINSKAAEPEHTTYKTVENNRIVCLKCGKVQPAGRKQCWDCGAKFDD